MTRLPEPEGLTVRRITVGWFVRQGSARGKGQYLAWTEYSKKGMPIHWDNHFRLLFKRKRDAMQSISRLRPGAARLVRHTRRVLCLPRAERFGDT